MGVDLKKGYNSNLTSREAGSVGGQMVKKMCPVRTASFERSSRILQSHKQDIDYIATIQM